MSDDIDLAQQHEEMHSAHAIAAALEHHDPVGVWFENDDYEEV